MGRVWLLVFLSLAAGQEVLQDGVATTICIDSVSGGQQELQFSLNTTVPGLDLFLSTTTFSDWSSPQLFVSAGIAPSLESYDYALVGQTLEELEIPSASLHSQTTYYVLVVCQTYCRFSLLLSLQAEVQLKANQPLRFGLNNGEEQVFVYTVNSTVEQLTIAVLPIGRNSPFFLTVAEGGIEGETFAVQNSWLNGESCTIDRPKQVQYWVTIRTEVAFSFYISAYEANGVTTLRASDPEYGLVGLHQWQQYKVYIDDRNATLEIQTSTYTGTVGVYVKAEGPPTLASYDLVWNHAGNDSISLDSHQRIALNKTTGWYYVGLYGYSPCAYILTASLNPDGMVPLKDGVTYSGYLAHNEQQYFYVQLSLPDDIDITISAQILDGDLDLYVKLCADWIRRQLCKLTPQELEQTGNSAGIRKAGTNSQFRTVKFRLESGACGQAGCRYIVLVKGKGANRASFLLSVHLQDLTVHGLREGMPFYSSLSGSEAFYFQLAVLDARVTQVTFQLSVFSGQCLLCLSPYEDRPIGGECTKEAGRRGDLREQMVGFEKGLDFEELNITYYATVQAEDYCSFSLLNRQSLPGTHAVAKLFPGISQRDVLWKTDQNDLFRLYKFDLYWTENAKKDVDITLTPFSGAFRICVAANATSNLGDLECQWSSDVSGSQQYTVHIGTSDPKYIEIGTYMVKITAISWTSSGSASYSLIYSSGSSALYTLETGIPLSSTVLQGSYRFYSLPIPHIAEDQSLVFSLSALSGDPDLYVSLRTQQPRIDHNDYKGERYGSEQLTVVWDDKMTSDGSIYIGVYGYTDAEYTLIVTGNEVNPSYLLPGTPLEVQSAQGKYQFFSSLIDSALNLQIILQAYIGNAQIYLNLVPVFTANDSDWLPPSSESHQFRSISNPHRSILTLQPMEIAEWCNSACRADISVICLSEDCRYSIELDQGQEIRLIDGFPQLNMCAREGILPFRYYKPSPSGSLQVSVTAISSGNPDLYISKQGLAGPENYKWKEVSWGNEFLTLEQGDMGGELLQGEYHIGILCDRAMTVEVLVRGSGLGIGRLIGGQPHPGYLHSANPDIFYYLNDFSSDIIVTLTAESGHATAYLLPFSISDDDMSVLKPSVTNSHWNVTASGSITIPTSNKGEFCLDCCVVLAVYSEGNSCIYTLLVRTKDMITTLLNGRPSEGRLGKGEMRKYVYEHLENRGLEVALSRYSGTATLLIATNPLVSPTQFNWSTSSTLIIPASDPAFHIGLYYLLVSSGSQSSYTLTLHSSNSTVRLVPGWPQTYASPYLGGSLMFEYVSDGNAGMCKLISMSKDFYPVVYASFTETTEKPGSVDVHRMFNTYNIFYELQISLWDTNPGKYTFIVQGNTTSSKRHNDLGEFEFYCLPANRTKTTVLGEVEYGVLDIDSKKQEYRLHVAESGLLTIIATPCAGKIGMTVVSEGEGSRSPLTVKRVVDGRLTAAFPCSPGGYLITVEELEEKELEESVPFQLSTFFSVYGSGQTMYYPGNEGEIQWSELPTQSISLSWSVPTTASGEPISSPETVQYRLYATLFNISLESACSMDTYESRELAWLLLPQEYGQLTATVKLPFDAVIWVNVLAIIDAENGPELYHIAYKSVEIYLRSEGNGQESQKTVLLVLAGIVFLLVLLVVLLFVKYCKAKQLQVKLVDMLGVETITQEFGKHLKSARNQSSAFAAVSDESS